MLSGDDNDFKAKVMQIYPHIKTALELMHELNMSATAFNRKFQKAFGYSARQWLIQKKKEKLFRDIYSCQNEMCEFSKRNVRISTAHVGLRGFLIYATNCKA